MGAIYIERDGISLAKMLWNGGRYSGSGRVIAIDGHRAEAKQIRDAISARDDLRRVRFDTPRGDTPGWRGFDGNLNALIYVVPTLGFEIGLVEWPPDRLK